MFERYRKISACYPEQFSSLLDISACRGFYVFDASKRWDLDTAVGVDVVADFIDYCKKAQVTMGDSKSCFLTATLEQYYHKLLAAGKQLDVTVFTGSYHYFYWGSAQNTTAYMDHDKILGMLAAITRKRVIFSGRLEISLLADYPGKIAATHPQKALYDTAHFLESAGKYFDVTARGFLGKSRLFVLDKR